MRLHLIVVALVLIGGCAPQSRSGTGPWPTLVDHPRAVVRVPASVGARIGTMIGIPVMVAVLPLTVPAAAAKDADLLPIVPLLLLGEVVSDAVAAPGWLLFGWWGPRRHRLAAAPPATG